MLEFENCNHKMHKLNRGGSGCSFRAQICGWIPNFESHKHFLMYNTVHAIRFWVCSGKVSDHWLAGHPTQCTVGVGMPGQIDRATTQTPGGIDRKTPDDRLLTRAVYYNVHLISSLSLSLFCSFPYFYRRHVEFWTK